MTTRRRSGRLIWVQQKVERLNLSANQETSWDLLEHADPAHRADCTVVAIFANLNHFLQAPATPAFEAASFYSAFIAANENIAVANLPRPSVDTESGAYMWHSMLSLFTDLHGESHPAVHRAIQVKSKRRLRSASETIWYLSDYEEENGDPEASELSFFRTLLYVP